VANLPKKVVVVGALGMLGRDLVPVLSASGVEVFAFDARDAVDSLGFNCARMDITKKDLLRDQLALISPEAVINCAAYTNVDQAETEYNAAFSINGFGVENLALACRAVDALLVHISTDYVFGGMCAKTPGLDSPFSEESEVCPCGLYGYSKYLGEVLLRSVIPDNHLIVRTSWLHGRYGNNFVHTMLRLGRERSEIKVVDDQLGSPTFTVWLAQCLCRLLKGGARGTFHASSRGGISWHAFAKEIFLLSGMKVNVLTQTSAELNRPAPRPPYSTLDVSRLEDALGESAPSWRDGLINHLRLLGELRES
jgi:dTDP-4-dehydrorhamnose reductase